MNKPAAFTAALLGMLALVVVAQLLALGAGVRLCFRQAEVVFEHQRASMQGKQLPPLDPLPGPGCDKVRQDFREAVERSGGLVLALLGGSGVAAAAAHGSRPPER